MYQRWLGSIYEWAGLPLLDFTGYDHERQQVYFAEVQHGMDRNYQPMEKVFSDMLERSLQDVAG